MKTPCSSRWLVLALFSLAAPAAALAANSTIPSGAKPAEAKTPAAPAPAAPAASAPAATNQDAAALFQVSDYKLRPTDVINVNVADDVAATKDYRISVKGTVTLVYLNDHPLKVSGLTKDEATDLIRKTYMDEKIYKQPAITVDVREFSVRTVNIIGQVAKPGQIQIPAQKEMTLVTAIAAAGGPTERADTEVRITRILPDGKTQTLEHVDLKGAVKDASKDIPIQEGDTIFLGASLIGGSWFK